MSCLFIALCALFVSVLAESGTYVVPELPCEWTLIWNGTYMDRTYYYVQQVNGRFARVDRVGANGNHEEFVLRNDLNCSLVYKFGIYSGKASVESGSYDSMKKYCRPIMFGDASFDFNYSSKQDGSYYGKECSIYFSSTDSETVYVDPDGLPIGRRGQNKEINYTWYWKADLSWFVFPHSVSFADDRIYTQPVESICQQSTSSSGGQSSITCTYKTCWDGVWKQTTDAEMKAWEEQSTECEQFTCDCDSGYVSYNSRYVCTGESDVCVNDHCGAIEMFVGSGASVVIDVERNLTKDEVNITELEIFISQETKIDEDTINVALNVDTSYYVIQVVVFVEDEKDAEVIVGLANELGKSNCTTNILCETKSTYTLVAQLDSCHRDFSNTIFVVLMMMMLLLLSYIAYH